jgi:hypothetical protein
MDAKGWNRTNQWIVYPPLILLLHFSQDNKFNKIQNKEGKHQIHAD